MIFCVGLTLTVCGEGQPSETQLLQSAETIQEEQLKQEEQLRQETGMQEEKEATQSAGISDKAGGAGDEEKETPTKEEVLSVRRLVLEGMSEEEQERLKENIKVANLCMERAYLRDDLFGKLSDKESLYWNYYDQSGEIQIGWAYDGSVLEMKEVMEREGLTTEQLQEKYGEPVMAYNRFDAKNFVELIQEMQETVQNELLAADLQQLIELTELAAETHEMEYASETYKILHDMDYYLFRYGPEDVGRYTQDAGVVTKYYGVLKVYGQE